MPVKVVRFVLSNAGNGTQESSGDHRRVDSDRINAAANA